MASGNRHRPLRRPPSVVFVSDEDEPEENIDIKKEHPQATQYSTPMIASNQLRLMLPTLTDSFFPDLEPLDRNEMEVISLMSPTVSPTGLEQPNYRPYTLNASNQNRLLILPNYPHSADQNQQQDVLLCNVPGGQLSRHELARRQPDQYRCAFKVIESHAVTTSLMRQQYQIYFAPLKDRFHCDLAILDYNYTRLKRFMDLYRLAYMRIVGHHPSTDTQFHFNENEYPQLLEFYLQMDVDLFFMKTCSFRQAQPRSSNEGLFCVDAPSCRYTTTPCKKCLLCCPASINGHRRIPSVPFNLFQKHRFVNGYESILNCPATCDTQSIIYVLTCPCGQYDYLGETRSHLWIRLSSHYFHVNRLIHEALLGESNFVLLYGRKNEETRRKDRMALYQHPMRCTKAIELFLDAHPQYWPFVPMTNIEADRDSYSFHPRTPVRNAQDESIQKYLDAVPKPPEGYRFSIRQISEQSDFFKLKTFTERIHSNNQIYDATIVAVLPLNTSDLFRQMLHSLFVTHTQSKLNTLGHLFPSPSTNERIPLGTWCASLRRRLTSAQP